MQQDSITNGIFYFYLYFLVYLLFKNLKTVMLSDYYFVFPAKKNSVSLGLMAKLFALKRKLSGHIAEFDKSKQ
jgi:hypothetical protein